MLNLINALTCSLLQGSELTVKLDMLQFEVAPNFGTFASIFGHPHVTFLNTPHMSMYSS